MLRVGTSGYGYHDWCPEFYPTHLPHAEYFGHYAKEFDFCELNETFFAIPSPSWSERWLRELPEGFVVTAKLHRCLTHERSGDLALARHFARRVRPLAEAGRLGAIVAQFPFSFVNHPDNRAYLSRLRAALELPLVAELRNESWHRPETLSFLKGWGVGLVSIDAPPLGGLPVPSATATSRVGYVRFHGRRASAWWRKDSVYERYDYRYRRRELVAWLPRIRHIARETDDVFIVFNNHRSKHAVSNARAFLKLVRRSRRRGSAAAARAG